MKAILLKGYGSTDNFQLEEVEEPQVKVGYVKVKIKATAFNPIDYQMRKGGMESKLLDSTILGREMSGIIVEIGEDVKEFSIGDEVYSYISNAGSNGSYDQFVVVPKEMIALKPKNLSFEQSAAIAVVGITALQTLQRTNLKKEDIIFVAGGAGGVGSMLIRLMLKNGITNIYTTAGSDESREQVINYGLPPENIFNYNDTDIVTKILDKTKGKLFSHCFDTVGFGVSETCSKIIDYDGVYADIAFLMTDSAREMLFHKAVTLLNIAAYAYVLEKNKSKMQYYNDNLTKLTNLIEEGSLIETSINVLGNFSVETVVKAHQLLETNQTKGKKQIMRVE